MGETKSDRAVLSQQTKRTAEIEKTVHPSRKPMVSVKYSIALLWCGVIRLIVDVQNHHVIPHNFCS